MDFGCRRQSGPQGRCAAHCHQTSAIERFQIVKDQISVPEQPVSQNFKAIARRVSDRCPTRRWRRAGQRTCAELTGQRTSMRAGGRSCCCLRW